MKDGIHTILGNKVYVEDGRVLYAVAGTGVHYRVLYIYRYIRPLGWLRVAPMTVSAFRHALERGTVRLA